MQIQQFMNTMTAVLGKHTRLLCDPWVTTQSVSRGNIYNYPPLPYTAPQMAQRPYTHLHITHAHPDHFDPDTLAAFDRNLPVLVGNWPNNFLARGLEGLGFRHVHCIDWEQGYALGNGDHVWIKISDAYRDVDSLSVWRIDDKLVINTNDCGFVEAELRAIKQRFGHIDVALIAASLVGPYPQFYTNLTVEDKERESSKKKQRNLGNLLAMMRILEPTITLPFGGGVLYGGHKTSGHRYTGVASREETEAFLRDNSNGYRYAVLPPTGSYDVDMSRTLAPEAAPLDKAQLAAYRQEVAQKPNIFDEGGHFCIAPYLRMDLTPLFKSARQKLRKWQGIKRVEGEMNVFFETEQELCYHFNLANDEVARVPKEQALRMTPMMLFSLPYSLMVGILTRHFSFNNVGTPYITFYRDPNVFNPDHLMILNHLHL
jgi:L-ascorbate metabolism protein UlaG (beta-lactamase superfamily)